MIRDYVALDLEMTGLSPRKDAILEIGAVKVRDMEVTETYTAMVNPGFPGSGACHRADRDHDRNGTAGQGKSTRYCRNFWNSVDNP